MGTSRHCLSPNMAGCQSSRGVGQGTNPNYYWPLQPIFLHLDHFCLLSALGFAFAFAFSARRPQASLYFSSGSLRLLNSLPRGFFFCSRLSCSVSHKSDLLKCPFRVRIHQATTSSQVTPGGNEDQIYPLFARDAVLVSTFRSCRRILLTRLPYRVAK